MNLREPLVEDVRRDAESFVCNEGRKLIYIRNVR